MGGNEKKIFIVKAMLFFSTRFCGDEPPQAAKGQTSGNKIAPNSRVSHPSESDKSQGLKVQIWGFWVFTRLRSKTHLNNVVVYVLGVFSFP